MKPLRYVSMMAGLVLAFAAAGQGHAAALETGAIFLNPMGASIAEQNQILSQMKAAGVHLIRTAIRNDDASADFANRAYADGIKIDALIEPQYTSAASGTGLSAADPAASQAYFTSMMGKLEAKGVVLGGLELGNEINWAPFNGDFPRSGQGKIFGARDLSSDPVGQQVAKGYIKYIQILTVLKNVRDHSKLNQATPILSAGLANNGRERTVPNSTQDGVTINATLDFLRANGLDHLVDAYGIHYYPWNSAPTSRKENLEQNAVAECKAGGKPCWITEWGVGSKDTSCTSDDPSRLQIIAETMQNFRALAAQDRLAVALYYTWNSNPASKQQDASSIYRCGQLSAAGQAALR